MMMNKQEDMTGGLFLLQVLMLMYSILFLNCDCHVESTPHWEHKHLQ